SVPGVRFSFEQEKKSPFIPLFAKGDEGGFECLPPRALLAVLARVEGACGRAGRVVALVAAPGALAAAVGEVAPAAEALVDAGPVGKLRAAGRGIGGLGVVAHGDTGRGRAVAPAQAVEHALALLLGEGLPGFRRGRRGVLLLRGLLAGLRLGRTGFL